MAGRGTERRLSCRLCQYRLGIYGLLRALCPRGVCRSLLCAHFLSDLKEKKRQDNTEHSHMPAPFFFLRQAKQDGAVVPIGARDARSLPTFFLRLLSHISGTGNREKISAFLAELCSTKKASQLSRVSADFFLGGGSFQRKKRGFAAIALRECRFFLTPAANT